MLRFFEPHLVLIYSRIPHNGSPCFVFKLRELNFILHCNVAAYRNFRIYPRAPVKFD